jgi:hypothetical protein
MSRGVWPPWRRARAELARHYAVGLLGHGAGRPAWPAAEAPGSDHEDVEP